ncbi:MAG: hypothetical protein L0I29_08285 [Hyphomicrobiales bacterium]|nr:hypothetical protein [Hyphomicrobiales bacterium]
MPEPILYDMRQSSDSRWEVFEVLSGKIVALGGLLLVDLPIEAAKGALDVLHNRILPPDRTPDK